MEAYPLQWPAGWPREKNPTNSRFGDWKSKPTIYKSTSFLIEELRRLTGKKYVGDVDYVLSSNLRLKLDGLPYSNQKDPDDKGIAVYFKFKGEAMVIACDTYDKIGCNIWAVAKTIEAMRGIDRWGCSELLQRAFTGFKALPENASENTSGWWTLLGCDPNASMEEIKASYKSAAKKYHPDNKETGDTQKFQLLHTAYQQGLAKHSPLNQQ